MVGLLRRHLALVLAALALLWGRTALACKGGDPPEALTPALVQRFENIVVIKVDRVEPAGSVGGNRQSSRRDWT